MRVPMGLWRPFRRSNRNLGTMGGNQSVTDEVVAEGPPGIGLATGLGFWDQERSTAVTADLDSDIVSDFDHESTAEDAVWDTLGRNGSDEGGDD